MPLGPQTTDLATWRKKASGNYLLRSYQRSRATVPRRSRRSPGRRSRRSP